MNDGARPTYLETTILTTCRLIAGGALVLAAMFKLRDPSTFMLSINSFKMVPEALIPYMAYALPWTEMIAGVLLVYGAWSRAAAAIAAGLYALFTLSFVWVLAKGLPVDCGCFGGLFGSETVGAKSILRNLLLAAAAVAIVWRGGGATALDAHRPTTPEGAEQPAAGKDAASITAGQPT